jgi:hypothetical protein
VLETAWAGGADILVTANLQDFVQSDGEVGLLALAKAVGVRKQNDWGKYLDKIRTELDARMKASGKHTPDEEFYGNALIVFDPIRRVRRNVTMHIDKSYTVERAAEIFEETKSLMRHLSSRLKE